jgi:sorbose reductase
MDTVLNARDNLRAMRDMWASRCPMGRMEDMEELTGAEVILCSERAGGYISGADIMADGGTRCFSPPKGYPRFFAF